MSLRGGWVGPEVGDSNGVGDFAKRVFAQTAGETVDATTNCASCRLSDVDSLKCSVVTGSIMKFSHELRSEVGTKPVRPVQTA